MVAASPQYKGGALAPLVGADYVGRLCRRGGKRVLRIDGLSGPRVLKFDGAFGPEGCGLPLCGNAYKVGVTGLPSALIVIRGRSADNRKAPLNFSFPLEGKCHVVAKGCTRVSIPMKLTIVLLGPTSADLETLCRVSTKRRILVRTVSRGNATKYQSAGRFAPWLIFPATSHQSPATSNPRPTGRVHPVSSYYSQHPL